LLVPAVISPAITTTALFLLDEPFWDDVYGPAERQRLRKWTASPALFRTKETILDRPDDLADVEVILSGWSMPRCDEVFLSHAPRLKAIFYAAGTVRGFVDDALWERGIVVSTSNEALARTVADFALGQILLSLKGTWSHQAEARTTRRPRRRSFPGLHGSTVGLVSLGAISRHLVSLLRHFDLRVIVYDPFLDDARARALGVRKVALDELFREADVVSLHTPQLPETVGMIRGRHFALMKPGASFINTARGAIVDEAEMIEALRRRPDLYALLDVTTTEPTPPDSPLHDLPNILLTPHIAGPQGTECRRLGAMAVDELERYLTGLPLRGEIRREMLATIA